MKKLLLLFYFTFSISLYAADYYWVGGGGNWSDISNWSTTSGGNTNPSVIPGPTDNVYFDHNSGFTSSNKTLTLDIDGNCKNISFIGNVIPPIFTGTNSLNIYGSSEWQAGMTYSVSTTFYRNSNTLKTIKSNGVNFDQYVYLEETSTVNLLDDFSSIFLYVNAGTWNTNNHNISVNYIYANSTTNPKTLNLGSSKIYLTRTNSIFNTNNSSVTVNAGTSHIYFTLLNSTSTGNGLITYNNQQFYNVTFEGVLGRINSSSNTSFNIVTFLDNGLIYGNNKFNELHFSATKTYNFESGKTQNIINLFSANTTQCGGWSTITSTTSGSVATILAPNTANINVTGVILKDITATGGAVFNAFNSIDNENNNGWIFPIYSGINLYWVGGNGEWNDRNHWAQSSGGTGGYCVPGPKDNTFFDENSGFTTNSKTVTVDNISYTNNIIFHGNGIRPTLTGASSLNIYGSSEWQTGMTYSVGSTFYRNTNSVKTVKSNGVIFGQNVYFEEKNTVNLLDDLSGIYFYINAGTWNTNSHNIYANYFFANSTTNPKTLNFGSSKIYLTRPNSIFNTNTNSVTINAGTSHIYFTALNSNSTANGLLAYSNQQFYDVTFEGPLGRINSTSTVYFNKVTFLNNGLIYGSNTYNELHFYPTKTYTIESGRTQTIRNLFSAITPQCGGWSTISSTSTSVSPAIIFAPNTATINAAGIILKDIHATGGAIFNANYSIDNGNTTGWNFPLYSGVNLYWVGGTGNWNDRSHWAQTSGGTGGYCVPGPKDNTFFDENSGFLANSKTITVDNISYTNNITFNGSVIPPIITGESSLNIYGSSELQNGMTYTVATTFYRNTNSPKTIKSNDVIFGQYVYFEETTSIDILDDFSNMFMYVNAGTLNTNNHSIYLNYLYANTTTNPKTLNFGSSNIYLTRSNSIFNTNSASVTLNAGTSHIYFTVLNSTSITNALNAFNNQQFYNVTFQGPYGRINSGTNVTFNNVTFLNSGYIYGNNNFNELNFSSGKTYTFESNKTQNINKWQLGGTPCGTTFIKSSIAGTRTNINVTGNDTNFNFANLKDINASGNTLHFGEQSTIANQNNNNITFDPYNPGAFSGLGADWINHLIDENDPDTYILNTNAFYGDSNTQYKWFRESDQNLVIATTSSIDLRYFGFDNYIVEVNYSNGNSSTCNLTSRISIKQKIIKAFVNPNLRMKIKR